MNFKKILNLLIIAILSLSVVLCASSKPKEPETTEETPAEETVDTSTTRSFDMNLLDEINVTLKEYRYPDGVRRKGFSYKKADVIKEDFNLWAKENVNFIKEALDKLPADYKLVARGHADASGPEEAEGSKKGNVYYSTIRAEAVKEALVKQGLPAERITTQALGSTEPVQGFDDTDEINRRVTFQVMKSETPAAE
ncbi:MAG: OmpA family protein [Leptospiraceae bacterium]|nr:OmpA family protein [Leptospiraceae bacterium]